MPGLPISTVVSLVKMDPRGSRVRLEDAGGDILEGYIHSLDQNVGKIILQKVTLCGQNKKKLQGLLHYQFDEIKDLEVLQDVDGSLRSDIIPVERDIGPRLTKTKEIPRHLKNRPNLVDESLITQTSDPVAEEDLGRLTRTDTSGSLKSSDYDSSSDVGDGSGYGKFNVIDKMDEVFREAIDYIRSQSVIGVGLEGVSLGREGKLCWLSIATKEEILLFDILSLGIECFQQGLQDILESGHILKVMHDCRQPSDLLYHQFGVELVNLFDTQVSAVFIYRMVHQGDYPRYVESQHSLLVQYLDIDLSDIHILRYREKHKKEDQEIWCQRPAPLNILTAASKQVKHLMTLRIKLMEQLLKEVNVGTEIYLGYVRDASKDDAKRGLTTRHLLPHAFQHLNTHMDFHRHCYRRPARMYSAGPQKDERGFDENCEGVVDPYIVASSDSIWHQGKNFKSPAFRRRSEGDQALKRSPAIHRDSNSLPNSPADSVMSKSSPTKHGHCVSRGPAEVRRPTTSTAPTGDVESAPTRSRHLKHIPEVSEPKPKTKPQSVQQENIEFIPAGYSQYDQEKKRHYRHSEDSDMENPIQIGDYSCPEESDIDDSFSCIPSRESLGRHHPSEHTVSLRQSMEAFRNAEDESVSISDTDDHVCEVPVSRNVIQNKAQGENRSVYEDEQDLQELQNRRLTSSFNCGSDTDTCLSNLSNLQIKSPPQHGMGRGICRFTVPASPHSSHSSDTSESRPSIPSIPSPQELLNYFEGRSKPSTSTQDTAEKSILQSMVNSDSGGSSPYGRQMSLLKSLSSAKQNSSSGSSSHTNSHLSDDASTTSDHSQHSRTRSQKVTAPAVTFDGLMKRISSKQY